ncbi:Peroxiredoxin [Ekhidna lutea]|uniref:Peroxiredoxin n=1 Tax=Ekhidna lutea TaxID=447679 RepID=A0A239J6Z3_EKHLU|nr:thioredoxin family protein [Ekhidna lutea]SNT00424.1 Peroxiredoxin [Ekhidna lutea]
MAAVESNMMPLGTVAPDFSLPDVVSGQIKTLEDVRKEYGVVVMFICAHCPYVKNIEEEIAVIARQYGELKIGFVAISSNDAIAYPDDAPDKLRDQAEEFEFDFPYLYDETQEVAKAYQAACTPEFYLFDEDLKCIYRGRFDASTPGNPEPVTGDDLVNAIEAHLEDEPIFEDQKPSIGCSIKWK